MSKEKRPKSEASPSNEREHYSAQELTALFVAYCLAHGCDVFDVISPAEERSVAEDGTETIVKPGVRLAPYKSTDAHSLFVRSPEGDYLVWSHQSETEPSNEDKAFEPRLKQMRYNSVDIHEKSLPKVLKPADLNELRFVQPGLQLQYRFEEAILDSGEEYPWSYSMDVFDSTTKVDTFLRAFVASLGSQSHVNTPRTY